MNTPGETRPSRVPVAAPQGGEVLARWIWAEHAVWTERMLTALEEGVKGGVWFRLIDKVWSQHPNKTRIVDVRKEGFDFLGYHFQTTRRGILTRWARKKSLAKLKETIRAKTKRTDGSALPCIIADVNRTLRGWFGYFKNSHRTTFTAVDGWVRGRLRSILRKRAARRGRGRGRDHQRWPNAYFAAQGYFSLEAAFDAACQSPCG